MEKNAKRQEEILEMLCGWKKIKITEAETCLDHVYISSAPVSAKVQQTVLCTISEKSLFTLVIESLRCVLFFVQAFKKQFDKSSKEHKKELAKKWCE